MSRRPPPIPWEEEECLDYYGMVSLHRLFEVVGAQLTPTDVAALAALLDRTPPGPDPSPRDDDDNDQKDEFSPKTHHHGVSFGAKSGREVLLELERRGWCDEGNFRHLLGFLRLLARQDLLRCVTLRRPRPVSPERIGCDPAAARPRRRATASGKRKRTTRGRTRAPPPPRRDPPQNPTDPPQDPPAKVTCDIRLRVRAEYCEHESALRRGVASTRPRGPGRQLDVFGQASGVLKSRDLGSILCDIKFSELSYLEAFWGDYLSGALLEALKGVFLGGAGPRRTGAGREGVRLLVSVDQDDYEEGRRRLLGAARGGGGAG
ncbi:DNA-binding death effector domain-containing protein 2 [Athene noctua]|uniref:DNA-binding death effector domain-containing protein 2 n=1 Tax=Athene noctua TaxID=126797 RepID=UPI003EB862BB